MTRSAGLMVNYVYWLDEGGAQPRALLLASTSSLARRREKLARECVAAPGVARQRALPNDGAEHRQRPSRPRTSCISRALLRAAGLRVGPTGLDCVRAPRSPAAASALRREDWYWTMSAVLLSRQEQRLMFDQAFDIFFRKPGWPSR